MTAQLVYTGVLYIAITFHFKRLGNKHLMLTDCLVVKLSTGSSSQNLWFTFFVASSLLQLILISQVGYHSIMSPNNYCVGSQLHVSYVHMTYVAGVFFLHIVCLNTL